MKIVVCLNYYEYIFGIDEKEEAMKFTLNGALRTNDKINVSIRIEKEVVDNE